MNWTNSLPSLAQRWRRHALHGGTRGLLRLTERCDEERLLTLGRGLGLAANWPLRKRLAYNLQCAGLTATPALLDRYFQLLGTWAGWSLAVYQQGFATSRVARRIHLDDSVAHLDRAISSGKGVILTTGHFFCHEMGAAAIHLRHPLVALIRESKDHLRHAIKQRWYQATGLEVVYRARRTSMLSDTLAYLRVLRAGKILAITPDLPVRPDRGVAVSLFGKQVILPSGMIALAMRSATPIVACWADWIDDRRGRPAEMRIRFDEPIAFSAGKDRDAVQRAGMAEFARRHEEELRKCPVNWMFWLDKNWTRILRTADK
jgi:lauroyl/myristoyl acyltransferase